ncbi:arginyltransferase [Alcaligenaceae bacterium 429]|uniref:arginyltransferase n=1 Tax=Paenalcaligenes sp. Me52 TaxID=3392038 RepID=UPI0010931847|nr:arginyltransferase [Alcaligenaceae bacterium 429]
MMHAPDPTVQPLQFYTTAPYICSYLPKRQARSKVAVPADAISSSTYSQLVDQGFRRSGTFVYKPNCQQCKACTSLRIDVHNFKADRTQRRVWKRLQHLSVQLLPLAWNEEHYLLYRDYQAQRHDLHQDDHEVRAQYAQFLLSSQVDSRLIEFRDPETQALKIVALCDMLDQGLSAVYTFFSPDSTESLGTYAILWQIHLCQSLGLPWLYLGYWIEQSRKMAYKTRFTPYQLLQNGSWSAP